MFGKKESGKQIVCPVCGSTNIQIQLVESGMTTRHRGNGLLGHANNTARALTGMATLGMSNLVWKKSKGDSKTKIKTDKVCICQNCGHSWKI